MTNKDDSSNTEFKLPDDWRGKVITKLRSLIKQTDSEIIEDVKWKTASNPNGVLVWYRDGMICTGEIYMKHLRFGFSKGVALKDNDPKGLINTYRAMVIHEGYEVDETAFKNLIRAAVALNGKGNGSVAKQK